MNARIKRLVIWCLGWLFIFLGILGLFLPVLQGILFLLIGLYLLSSTSPWAERLLNRLRERFPKISKTFEEAKDKVAGWQLFGKKEKESGD
ncbi:MAG TPA: PGPGW domain-containing protein [Blastocatellia bacterium]|nr:PGPGW domain-containing protein [Blastocatellia bacterium]